MEPLSLQGFSLTEKFGSSATISAGRKSRTYSSEEKALFFEAKERLGSISAAARELGFSRSTATSWAKDDGRVPGTKYTAGQKADFFVLLDRLGSVSAAARQLGINAQTAFSWSYSLAAVERKSRRRPSARQRELAPKKADFLAVLKRVGNVTVAAREAGVKRSQGASWARVAGVASVKEHSTGKQAEIMRLRAEGAMQETAITMAGAGRRTGHGRDQAAQAPRNPVDGDQDAPVAYKCSVTTAPIESSTAPAPAAAAPAAAPGAVEAPAPVPAPAAAPVSLEDLERPVSARYLSLPERMSIADLLHAGKSIRAIAQELGRNPGSISREVKRNSHPTLGYLPYGAEHAATTARARPKPSKLAAAGKLREYVADGLRIHWSPEQISNTLIKEFPDDEQMRVSHETIYQALYLQARGGLKREVSAALRTGRTRRKNHKNPEERTSRFRDPMVNISERPPEVEDRAVPGHWEGDLITGAHNQSAIATLVERTTRYVMLVHLPGDHSAETVRDGLIKTMSTLPAHLRGSLTWDQGVEMAKHKAFSLATDMDVYFCDPHSPWQRGSNENTNGLLRQYFPKGTDLNAYSPEDLEHVAQELNARPRKTLNWNTPAEQLRDLLIPS